MSAKPNNHAEETPEPLDLLEELYFAHLQKWADADREAQLLALEIVRLEKRLGEAMARAEDELAETKRIHFLAWNGREVEE